MGRSAHPARKQELVGPKLCLVDPGKNGLPGLFRDLELHRAVGFLLHDDRSGRHPIALRHIANPQPDEITAAQLAVDGQVEKSKVPNSIGQLKADPDPPKLFQLEWELLAD